MSIELNAGQSKGVDLTEQWYKSFNKPSFEIDGRAGTGKTTLAYSLIDRAGLDHQEEVLFVTFTGKAALELTKKGCRAATIHSTFYEIIDESKKDENGDIVYELGIPVKVRSFVRKKAISHKIKLIVVDEAGMVPANMREDILHFGVPVIALGDLFQLPPVFGVSAFLQEPDWTLTEIMRQALGDPIIYLSDLAANNRYIDVGTYGPKCHVINKDDMLDDMLRYVDVVICGKNDTRHKLNYYIRKNILGIGSPLPVQGDKLICRKNSWDTLSEVYEYPLVNGMVGYVKNKLTADEYDKSTGTSSITLVPEFEPRDRFEDLDVSLKYINDFSKNKNQKPEYRFDDSVKMEYGYAITGHLSQGSQYGSVLVYNEYLGGNIYSRWLYTVITRAIDFLIIAR